MELKLFAFDELPNTIQENIIEQNRDINITDDWFRLSVDFQKERLEQFGWMQPEIYFSGFYSQGDGLCFDAHIEISMFCKTPNEKRILKLIESGTLEPPEICKTFYANHYVHEKTRSISFRQTAPPNIFKAIVDLEEKLEKRRLNICRTLYTELQCLYENLTSDKKVIDTILFKDNKNYLYTKEGYAVDMVSKTIVSKFNIF